MGTSRRGEAVYPNGYWVVPRPDARARVQTLIFPPGTFSYTFLSLSVSVSLSFQQSFFALNLMYVYTI